MGNHMPSPSELHDQGFYQNLSIYRGQNISQPNLGQPMSPLGGQQQQQQQHQPPPSNRPVSAYYPNAATGGGAGMAYQMIPEHPQQSSYSNEALGQHQQATRAQMLPPNMNHQMMAPSMPNIAHPSGYASNISASQSMQNMNYPVHYQPQFQQQQQQPNQQLRGQAKLAEMGELLKRRQQRDHTAQLDIQAGAIGQQPSMSPMMMSPSHGNAAPKSSILGQTMQMSPLRQLPPTAPKPQVRNCGGLGD